MKRIRSLLLALIMLASLAACGKGGLDLNPNSNSSSSKALQMKVCANLGKEEETSKIILALLFDTKIVCLQTISVQIQEQTKNTKIEIYDEKVLDGAITVEKLNWTEKNKKKRKLFD